MALREAQQSQTGTHRAGDCIEPGLTFLLCCLQATFNTLFAQLAKREIKFKTTEKTVMAATVTDAANKAKTKKKSWTREAYAGIQVSYSPLELWLLMWLMESCLCSCLRASHELLCAAAEVQKLS